MIAEYEKIEKVCRTAGSDLWRARRPDGGRVLLKILPEGAPPERVHHFRREYQILRALESPGVPKAVALIEEGGATAIALEDVEGDSLESVLARRDFTLPEALGLAIRLTAILADVHAAGIVHHDLRPANFLMNPDGRLFLVDCHFAGDGIGGVASAVRNVLPPDADASFLAPEQTGRVNRGIDYRCDFYAAGIVIYRLLTGRFPFEADSPRDWVHCHVACRPRSLLEVDAEMPPAVSDLVMKLLEKEADDRYQSAHGLRFDLERCQAQLDADGRIVPFPLGTHDIRDRFRIAQKLAGRETEIATLAAVCERVAESGWPEVVMISGGAGAGKSSLANELRPTVERRRGYFIAGKFDPIQRDVPYAVLALACRQLIEQIATEREAEIVRHQRRLREALGTSGKLIVDFVPELEPIIGPQPAVAELPPAEAQNRFHAVFRRFIGALSTAEHPLVLFLDDLHWIDAGSLKLIETLATHPDTRHLLVIGAFRPADLGSTHPLLPTLTRIAKVGVKMLEIVLGHLTPEDLNQFVAATLQCAPEEAAPLARLIYRQTEGNPFFVVQLLRSLNRQELLAFDKDAGRWTWDLAAIEAQPLSDNVMDFLAGKLRRLGEPTEEVMRLAGCLGSTFELETLAVIWGRTTEETAKALIPAVADGMIVRDGRHYRFLHDHFHQAACGLIPPDQQAEVHLRIGRVLLAHMPAAALEDRLFQVVTQLNRGSALMTAQEERIRVAELNLQAARRAKAANAYQAAVSYLAAGARLLGCDAWERRDPLSFALFFERAECEFLCGNFARAERLFPILLRQSGSRLDRAAVYRIKIDTLTTGGRDEEAIESALECLRMFDLDIPPHPGETDVAAAYEEIWTRLGGRSIEELIDLPRMTDPELEVAMDVLARLYAPAYHLDNNLFYLHLLHGVNITLQHGNCPASTHAYGWFGVVLTRVYHRPGDGHRFARLAFDLMQRHHFFAYRARAIFVLRIMAYWTAPLDRMLEYSRASFDAAVEAGDVPGACFTSNHTVMGMLLRGDHLSDVHREAERALEFVGRTGFRDVEDMIVGIERFIQAMRGNTRNLSTFDDGRFSESRFEAELTDDRMPTLLFYYHVVKMMARFLAGDYRAALAAGERSRSLLWAGLFSPQSHCFHVYYALTLASIYPSLPTAERYQAIDTLAAHRDNLRQAAEDFSPTFHHSYALVAAEIARLQGREMEAERLYDEAVRSAKDNGFVQDEGLANELAGRFYIARGLATIAEGYFRQARSCYVCWGAAGKVRQLDATYPHLRSEPKPPAVTLEEGRLLDTLAVVKASQAISSQIILHRLLDTLMRNVMVSAGARTGFLLLLRPAGLVLAAEAHIDESGLKVQLHRERRDFTSILPSSLLDHVRRTREKVVLNDAGASRFAADPYLSHRRPRSILCLPIACRAELIALLYLEHDLLPNAFSTERVAVLELLAAQAAVSLENALLYRELRQENAERRRVDRALRESEARFRTAFTHAVIGMALLDLEGRFTQVNRSLCDILGYGESELLGRNFIDITHPEDVASSIEQVRRVLGGEIDSFQMTKRYRHKGGQILWAEVSVALIGARDGDTPSCVALIQDMTERRRAEAALQENRRLLQSIIDNSMAYIYVKDLQGRYLLTNRRCQDVFKIVPGMTDYDVLSREQAEAFRAFDAQVLAAEAILQREEVASLPDGVHTFISIKAPLRDSSGRINAICGVTTDISDLKRQERHLAAQYAIAGVLAGSSSLAEAAPRLLQILCESLHWELGEVWTVDAKAGLIRHMQSWNIPSLAGNAFVAASCGIAFPSGAGLPGRVWAKGEPEWVPDVLTDTEFARVADAAKAGLHGAFAFPIRLGNQILGVMTFFNREMRQPDADLLEILTTIGNQVGQFIERKRAEEELRYSEARYRTLHRDNPTMIFTLDADGTILSVNPFAASQLGYAVDELEGESVLGIFHEEDRPAMVEQLRQCLRNPDKVYRWHLRKVCKDGALLWLEELAQAIYGQDGALNVLVVCQDITERRRAEEALREQEERFRYVALATRDAIYDWDIRRNHIWFNDTFTELYRTAEPVGTEIAWWEGHLHPDDRSRVLASINASFRERESFWFDEYRFRRFNGTFASIMDRGYILYDDEGNPTRMIGAMTDVTERKNALVETEAARDRIAAILTSVVDGLLVTDLSDRVVLMNEAAEALLGIRLDGTPWLHIESLLVEERLRRQIVAVRGGEQEKGTIEWERAPAAEHEPPQVLQARTSAMRSAEGGVTGTITIVRDVTREREIDRMKNEFISTAAHELRTPLTTVMGYLQLLQSEERFLPEERKEFLRLVYEKSEVLERIIRDLLDLSRVQAGKLVTVEKAEGDFGAMVRHAVGDYRAVTDRHHFQIDFPAEPVVLSFDPGKIGQVLDNLFSNAMKFSPAGGTIRVTGRRVDGEFQTSVADEGIGMTPDQVARIFDKFYRADASNTAVSGLGLGMSIVRNIIEAHGGRIWVESEPGRGTRVHFTLPAEARSGDTPEP